MNDAIMSQDLSDRYVDFLDDDRTQFCTLRETKRPFAISPASSGYWPRSAPIVGSHVVIQGLTSFQSLPEWSHEDVDWFVVGLLRDVTSSLLLDRVSRSPEPERHTRTLLFSPILQPIQQDVGLVLAIKAESEGESEHVTHQRVEPRALEAVRELSGWLELTEAELADLVGFSVRSIANWRQGRKPYPATVRNLYRVHALVESLVNTLGVGRARLWLSTQVDDVSRLDLLRSEDGLSRVLEAAAELLYERPERERHVAAEHEERAIEGEFDIAPRPDVMKSSLRFKKH